MAPTAVFSPAEKQISVAYDLEHYKDSYSVWCDPGAQSQS